MPNSFPYEYRKLEILEVKIEMFHTNALKNTT